MKAPLLARVRTRARLESRTRVRGLLDGGHRSVHAGRSLDFADLRDYVAGDDVKDIDWKATARHGRPLMRRYVAIRQHSVVLVVDTGMAMGGLNDATTSKREVAVTAAAFIAQLAVDGGDLIGLVAGPVERAGLDTPSKLSLFLPPRRGERHAESLLHALDDALAAPARPSTLADVIETTGRLLRRKAICVLITADRPFGDDEIVQLRRLLARHEAVHVAIGDARVTDPALMAVTDVVSRRRVPAFLQRHVETDVDLGAVADRRHQERTAALTRLGIVSCRIDRPTDAIDALTTTLERRQRARRHP